VSEAIMASQMRLRAILGVLIAIAMSLGGVTHSIAAIDTVWVRNFDGPFHSGGVGYDIVTDEVGNCYVAGTTIGDETRYIATIKYAPAGEIVWERVHPGWLAATVLRGNSLQIDRDGHVYVLGKYRGDVLLLKYSPSGDLLSWNTFALSAEDDSGIDFALYEDGRAVITATELSTNGPWMTTFMASPDGDILWSDRKGGTPTSLNLDANGDIWVVGSQKAIKYHSSGFTLAEYVYNVGAGVLYRPSDGTLDPDGNLLLTGTAWLSSKGDVVVTQKLSPEGDILWEDRFDSTETEFGYSVACDSQGNVAVTGTYGDIYHDCLTILYDENGTRQWARTYNGNANSTDWGLYAEFDTAGNVYVGGQGYVAGHDVDYLMLTYTHDGELTRLERHNGSANGDDRPRGFHVAPSGRSYLTGFNLLLETGRSAIGSVCFHETDTPPGVDIGFHRNPVLTSHVDIYVLPDEPLEVEPEFWINQQPVTMGKTQRVDATVYRYSHVGDPQVDVELMVRTVDNLGRTHDTSAVLFGEEAGSRGTDEFTIMEVAASPNPFNASAAIEIETSRPSMISLGIYNLLGRRVYSTTVAADAAGKYNVNWNGCTDDGIDVPSGVYFCHVSVGNESRTLKLVLLR
jgi:hypothetical protein